MDETKAAERERGLWERERERVGPGPIGQSTKRTNMIEIQNIGHKIILLIILFFDFF